MRTTGLLIMVTLEKRTSFFERFGLFFRKVINAREKRQIKSVEKNPLQKGNNARATIAANKSASKIPKNVSLVPYNASLAPSKTMIVGYQGVAQVGGLVLGSPR